MSVREDVHCPDCDADSEKSKKGHVMTRTDVGGFAIQQ